MYYFYNKNIYLKLTTLQYYYIDFKFIVTGSQEKSGAFDVFQIFKITNIIDSILIMNELGFSTYLYLNCGTSSTTYLTLYSRQFLIRFRLNTLEHLVTRQLSLTNILVKFTYYTFESNTISKHRFLTKQIRTSSPTDQQLKLFSHIIFLIQEQ